MKLDQIYCATLFQPNLMEDDPKTFEMEDEQNKSKWKTKKIQNDQKNQNGRRPKKFKMEDDQKKTKWNTTKKFKMEDEQKKIKIEDIQKNS